MNKWSKWLNTEIDRIQTRCLWPALGSDTAAARQSESNQWRIVQVIILWVFIEQSLSSSGAAACCGRSIPNKYNNNDIGL